MTVKNWSVSGANLFTFQDHKGITTGATYTSSGEYLYSSSEDGTVRTWPLLSPKRGTYTKDVLGITHIDWAIKNDRLATASPDKTVKIWNTQNWQNIDRLYFGNVAEKVRWQQDGNLLAILVKEDGVVLRDVKAKKTLRTLKPQDKEDIFLDMAFHPDGSQIATASKDKTVRVWNPSDGKLIDILRGHEHPVNQVRYHPDGKQLVTASENGTVKLWDTSNGNTIQSWKAHEGVIHDATFDATGKWLATAAEDTRAKIWDASTGTLQKEFCLGKPVYSIQFSPDGKRLAIGTFEGTVQIFDVAGWKHIKTLQGPVFPMKGLVWSPDGNAVAGGYVNGFLNVWEITNEP
jgi:WD40 repeat protein